jgi:thiol-disulfide isomerase/thioredoxin
MKNIVLFFLVTTSALSLQAQPKKFLNAFSKISLAEKPFTLTGTFVGYNPAVDSFRFCKVVYNHLYRANQQNHVGEIDKTGRFSITFPLNRPQEIMLLFEEELTLFYAIPGSSLDIQLDLAGIKAISKIPYPEQLKRRYPLTFTGTYAQLNKEYNAFKPLEYSITTHQDHYLLIDSLDQMAYKAYRLDVMQRQLDTLVLFNQQNNTSSEFRQLMTQYLRYYAAEDLLRYRWMHGVVKTKRPDVQLTPEYLSFLEEMPVNNEEALMTTAYSSFLLEYINLYRMGKVVVPALADTVQFISFLKGQGKTVDPAAEKYLTTPKELLNTAQKQLVDSFYKKYQEEKAAFNNDLTLYKIIDTIRKHITPGNGMDIVYARLIAGQIERNRIPFTDYGLDQLSRNIANTDLRTQLRRDNERLRNVLAGKMTDATHVRTALQVSSDKFFDELMKPYKGKVVYIDFWAPWCGPCMGEMPYSKELQQELAGKDVVFLYIGISCTKQSWENTIKDKGIEGEHYFANDNDGKLLSEKFNISGIPHYVLVDKTGKVADDHTLRPSDKTRLLKKINSLLK